MLSLDRIVLVQKWGVDTGAVWDTDQHRCLRYAELTQLLVEEILRRSINAVNSMTEIDGVQISLQDILFAVLHFQTGGIKKFLHLSR